MRLRSILFSLAVAAMAAACAPKATPLKTCIFPGDYPDPTILRDGNDFYMTHSSFTYFPALLVWHSTDLVHWEPVARAVEDGDYSIFAPDICKVNGKFYIYYPTSTGENYVVTADRPEGPWSAPVKLDVGGIDPGHVVAEDGNRYLYTNNGFVTPLTPDGLAAAGRPKKVYDGWPFPEEWETEGFWLESPNLFKRGDWFYLVTAEGGTAGPPTSHMVVVARSKSALGPWENSPHNPLVHTYSADEFWWSKGHGTLIDDQQLPYAGPEHDHRERGMDGRRLARPGGKGRRKMGAERPAGRIFLSAQLRQSAPVGEVACRVRRRYAHDHDGRGRVL